MPKNDQTENATPERAGTRIVADQGHSVRAPQPSASSAAVAGAVGPGALAAAETPAEVSRRAQAECATEAGGLTTDEIETLRGLAQQMGGVDVLIHWLQLHLDLK